ncbi:hypothetical protein [Williamwhitmania taraxaci]|uniref:ABC-2 type transport system permease protein n=1 Tax=Williamwhitmania taraxaci TaxID=1640674 RepID=A0A1G6NJ85_9BACT|nr:hypothetical protein [Williamwhitmania taraxaci]SDC67346.1 hypothetical protein SAMN05216323_104319 [Williamwhitmania taraxaci]
MSIHGSAINNRLRFGLKLVRYNLQIVFSGKFIWFLAAALAFYLFVTIMMVFNEPNVRLESIYSSLVLPGLLLMFYPTVFGIQHDADTRILEMLFGVPDYRFKVWLFRLAVIFLFVFLLLLGFGALACILVEPIPVFSFGMHLMVTNIFLGTMAFWLSTVVRNGNGTAVIMIIVGLFITILSQNMSLGYWDIFLNPFKMPSDLNQVVWAKIVFKNRIFLMVGSVVFILGGMLKLQLREKFI